MNEIASRSREYLENDAELGGDLKFAMLIQMESVFASDYVQANKIRTKFINIVENLFSKVDFIATPVQRSGAPKSDPMDYQCNVNLIL